MFKSAKIAEATKILKDAGLEPIKMDGGATAMIMVEMTGAEAQMLMNEPDVRQLGGFVTAVHNGQNYQVCPLLSIAIEIAA